MNKFLGPIVSLVTCLGMLSASLYTVLDTKLPLLVPVATGSIAAISGFMVVTDWKSVWGPLFTGKSSS